MDILECLKFRLNKLLLEKNTFKLNPYFNSFIINMKPFFVHLYEGLFI